MGDLRNRTRGGRGRDHWFLGSIPTALTPFRHAPPTPEINVGEKATQSRGRLTLLQGIALVYGEQRDAVNNSLRANSGGDRHIDHVFSGFIGVGYERDPDHVLGGGKRRTTISGASPHA